MSEQNKDGTWKLPDASVSLVWQEQNGAIEAYRASEGVWLGVSGHCFKGRWLPWQPPTFPTRKKTELRRAKVRVDGREIVAVHSHSKLDNPWTHICTTGHWACSSAAAVEVLQWLDPEYEDEV